MFGSVVIGVNLIFEMYNCFDVFSCFGVKLIFFLEFILLFFKEEFILLEARICNF